jgi:hypothetical protein
MSERLSEEKLRDELNAEIDLCCGLNFFSRWEKASAFEAYVPIEQRRCKD